MLRPDRCVRRARGQPPVRLRRAVQQPRVRVVRRGAAGATRPPAVRPRGDVRGARLLGAATRPHVETLHAVIPAANITKLVQNRELLFTSDQRVNYEIK